MDIATGSWFEYLNESKALTEGLRDIGLPEFVVDFIEDGMPKASEKAKVYAGNEWKSAITAGVLQPLQFTLVNYLIDQYGDYVQMQDSEEDQVTRLQARTATPYRDSATPFQPKPREMYDDEMIKRSEQVKFVIQNLKNVLAKPMGVWPKAFKKAVRALSKAGIPSEKVESTQEYLKLLLQQEFQNFWYRYDLLFAWLNAEPTNYELIKGEESLSMAYGVAQDDLNNREDPEQVIHTFDDGSYWYNLNVSNCSVEGERMGHCGSADEGVLVSLRKKKSKRKAPDSYVTLDWAPEAYKGATIAQIKGRENRAPPMELWDHIDWFIKNMNVEFVQETGQHSQDIEAIQEMVDYLATHNRSVSFEGAVDVEAIDEALNEITNNYDGEHTSISAEAQDPEEHGGAGIYVYMSGYATMQIELRWKGFKEEDGFYVPTLGSQNPDDPNSDSTTDDSLSPIPINSYGNEAREFEDESGLDSVGWDFPGEETEMEWEMDMIEGSHPPDFEGDPLSGPGPVMAVLRVSWSVSDTEGVEDSDDATRAFENFASEMENYDESYDEYYAAVRTKMAAIGYIAKTTYDRDREEMAAYDMDHWKVWSEKVGLEFWFRPHKRSDSLINSGGDIGRIPMNVMMWAHDETRDGHIDGLYRKIFGTGVTRGKIQSDDLSRNMARNLEKFYAAQEGPAQGQEQLPFGQEYEAAPARAVLAKDSRFIIEPTTKYHGEGEGAYPLMSINWRYTIGVDHTASTEEVQTVKDIVKYFNENPEMVQAAAEETIRTPLQGIEALAQATKEDVLSGRWVGTAIRRIDDNYGPRAMAGDDTGAEIIIMITKWIKENFDQMSEPEKYVAWFKYLKPMKEGYFRPHSVGPIELDDNVNIGMPEKWTREVQEQMKAMKTFSGTVRDYSGVRGAPEGEPLAGTLGEPQPVGESTEQQIDRIERLLQEKDPYYDLRIYSININVSVQKDLGGEVQETQTEIRGIEGVTTVRTVGLTQDLGSTHVATYAIKFELIGTKGRVHYRDRILIPGMMKVKGLRILRVSPMHRTNVRGTIRTVREHLESLQEFGFGGGPVQTLNRMTTVMPTPKHTLLQLAQEWSADNKPVYDMAMHADDMRYHVMIAIEELLPYISREFRAPKDAFDGMYLNFIKNGADAPVYVAIGKNNRVKITGNEQLVWFAKRAGLAELPVFLSYQKQV